MLFQEKHSHESEFKPNKYHTLVGHSPSSLETAPNIKEYSEYHRPLDHEHHAHGNSSSELNNRNMKAEDIYMEIQAHCSNNEIESQNKELSYQNEPETKGKEEETLQGLMGSEATKLGDESIKKEADQNLFGSIRHERDEEKLQKEEPYTIHTEVEKSLNGLKNTNEPIQLLKKENSPSANKNMTIIEKERYGESKNVGRSFGKKLGIASLITATCVGGCLLGKIDKSVIGGAGIAVFVASFLIQK